MALSEQSHPYAKSPTECYQAMLALLPGLGYRIIRKRDLGWLILAEKPADKTRRGVALSTTITCRPGPTTLVTIACEMRANDTQEEERLAMEGLFDLLTKRLN